MKRLQIIAAALILSSCSSIEVNAIQLPVDEKQRAFVINLNTNSQVLYDAYMSTDVKQRRLAEMYVAGVLDSTEGVIWCNYNVASPSAIQEQVFVGLKSTIQNSPDLRASKAITSNLKKLLPCKEQK